MDNIADLEIKDETLDTPSPFGRGLAFAQRAKGTLHTLPEGNMGDIDEPPEGRRDTVVSDGDGPDFGGCIDDVSIADCTISDVSIELLASIKNFVGDLSNVTTLQNFKDYYTIVNRIDESKVKAYFKLVNGFKMFFKSNSEALTKGDFEDLQDPNISYVTENGSFSFNFQKIYMETDEENQDVIKDHLNHIWNILNNKSREEIYIDKIFDDLKARFSPDMTREEQMMIAKDLFSDFQKQNLDVSIIMKAACRKARKLLLSKGSEDHSRTLVLIETVEEIDVNNFNVIQFMTFVGKLGTIFTDNNNPLSDLLSNIFLNNIPE
jgi:hypothetical protein